MGLIAYLSQSLEQGYRLSLDCDLDLALSLIIDDQGDLPGQCFLRAAMDIVTGTVDSTVIQPLWDLDGVPS